MKSVDKTKIRRKLASAGWLMLIAGVFNIVWLASVFLRILDLKETLHIVWILSPLPFWGLAIGFGGNVALSNVLAVIFILGILLSLTGSIFALRNNWGLALIGSIGALVSVPFLGIAAIILTLTTKHSLSELKT